MSVLNQSGEEQVECPLCMEPLEVDDLNFFPCTCGYQICRFCWHRIRTDENGLCPACRKAYPENPADFKPLSQEEVAKLKAEKRHKDQQRKQRITENRKHLANVRVVQRNLVFVVGLPMRLADSEVLKKHEYFGKFGKIHKVVINQSTSYAGSQGPSASAYVTYHRADDTLRAIQAVNNIAVDGRTIKASLGTTKYCSHFMKNQTCPKPDCMYLHELGDPEASFTKEEMQQGKHQEYEKKLHEQLLNSYNQANKDRKPTPSPPAVALNVMSCQTISSTSNCGGVNPSHSTVHTGQSCNKEAWPSLQPGVPASGANSIGTNTSSCSLASNSSSSSNNSTSNTHHISSKGESNPRRQKFDHASASKSSTTSYKKRHNSGEEHRGKTKEKLHCSTMEDHLNKALLNKANVISTQRLNSKSPKELATNDVQKLSIIARHQNHVTMLSEMNISVDDIHSEIPGVVMDMEAHEVENDVVSVGSNLSSEGMSGRAVSSGGRVLPSSHRAATLFEPDNNSFFSTNNFTKVAATAAGSGPEWPLNGLTLTHMPDVLPPVHSSEDWQAAFGFSNSANPGSLQQGASPNHQVVLDAPPTSVAAFNATSKDNEDCDPIGFESQNGQQILVQGFVSRSSHSTSMENLTSNIVQNSPDVYRVNDVGHLNENMSNFTLEDMPPSATGTGAGNGGSGNGTMALHPVACSENPTAISPSQSHVYPGNHPTAYVQEQAVFMVNRHHFLPPAAPTNMPHLIHNGVLPTQADKFLADFHLRQQNQVQNSQQQQQQQQQQMSMQIHNQAVLDSTNYGRHLLDGSANSNFLASGDCGSVMTSVNNVRNIAKLPNGTDVDLGEDEENYLVTEDEIYSNYGSLEQQKSAGDNSSDDYIEFDRDSDIGEQEDNEEVNSTKENTRLTDDELGFDPFHETQKALAEMMEKENMMLMLQGQQNHVPHPIQHVNHLHQQYQQHITHHPAHFSYAAQPSLFQGSNKVLPGYSASQHSLVQQTNHRLQHSVSGCNKLVEGLGPVPPRTRLPPPGFATAPNHMNAFGLGIPRAPTNTGSKILPFMGLGNSSSSSNNGTSSPIPQPLNNISNNIAHVPTLNSQSNANPPSMLFPHSSTHGSTANHLGNTYSLQNGSIINNTPLLKTGGDSFNVKEWPENLRSLLPNLNDASGSRQSPVPVAFSGSNSPTPPPCSAQSHPSMQSNPPKTWSGVGPCSDWTALDPAIMSSSRPHNFLASTATVAPAQHPVILHNANSHLNHQALNSQYLHIQTTTQWLRSLNGESCLLYGANGQNVANSEWGIQNHNSTSNSIAPPPPGFTLRMTSTQQTTSTIQNKSTVSLTQEMAKIGNV